MTDSRDTQYWPRLIALVDMNAFFASIEQLDNPEFRGRPVGVTNGKTGTCIITCSYEAVLAGAGMDLANVTRLNVYTTDVDALMEVHDDIVNRFDEAGGRHAGTLVGVTRLAFSGMLVELEATAVG